MQPFGYGRPDSAGGTDLMQLMKEGAAAPRHLVDINGLPCSEIALGADGLRLGALARMSDVADHPEVRQRFPAIAQALLASASTRRSTRSVPRASPRSRSAVSPRRSRTSVFHTTGRRVRQLPITPETLL